MTTYVYKPIGTRSVTIDDYNVSTNGLSFRDQVEVLDAQIGTSIERYDDGVLAVADTTVPAYMSADGKSLVGASGIPVMGTSAPTPFTTRTLAVTDNGQTCICASTQTATVNSSMPAGFGVAFKGAISFTAGAGVTVTDIRSTGAANPWCALVQTAADSYDIVGTKA